MTEQEKRERIKQLISNLLGGGTTEDEDIVITSEVSNLSPDPEWSDYIFFSFDYYDENENFLMEKFLDKIFNYEPKIIEMGYTPQKKD